MKELFEGSKKRMLPTSKIPDFRFSVSVDCVIFGYDNGVLKVLLIESDHPKYFGHWSLLGDVMKKEEDLDHASYRVLKERTGLQDMFLEQVKTFSAVDRHPDGRVISTAYLALVNVKNHQLKSMDNALHWHAVSEVTEMAFDLRHLFGYAEKKDTRGANYI
jgi:8-oxo-dGTP diphosphatase